MSYGFYRLGANVSGKVLPFIGPATGSAVILDPAPLPIVDAEVEAVAPTEVPSPRAMGYTGNTCTNCQGTRMMVAGHCEVCADCGTSSGCS